MIDLKEMVRFVVIGGWLLVGWCICGYVFKLEIFWIFWVGVVFFCFLIVFKIMWFVFVGLLVVKKVGVFILGGDFGMIIWEGLLLKI